MRQKGLTDPSRRRPAAKTVAGTGRPKPLTVTELTRNVKELIEHAFGRVLVEGELSNYRRYGSGHCYFTLKDAGAQLSGVVWRGVSERMRFKPEDGMKVVVRGRLSVYEPRGQYQIIVDHMEPAGVGALAAAFEALKRQLGEEGLFDQARKKALPPYPRRIALVTSGSGAAIRDLMKVILGRWQDVELIVAPVRVQGEGAAQEVAGAIEALNRLRAADVMIVGRGGGSLEDLWAFNEERVARAVFASKIPVISAVGHEVDFTICDYVADVRAATPSHAGEIVVAEQAAVVERLADFGHALPLALVNRLRLAREQVKSLGSSWALRAPEERVQAHRQHLDELQVRLTLLLERGLSRGRERLGNAAARLEGLSPLSVLSRGYSLTQRLRDGRLVRSWDEVDEGEEMVTRVARGKVISRVARRDADESAHE
jgi:exodeoxyribonuclease VII large subunit